MYQTIYESTYNNVVDFINKNKEEHKTNRAIRHFIKLDSELSYMIDINLEPDNQMIALDVINQITNLMYKNITTANTVLNQYNIKLQIVELEQITNMEKQNITTINYKIAVETFFNNLEVGRIPQTNMNLKVKAAYEELKSKYDLLDIEIKPILLKTFGNKKEYERVKLSMDFRLSKDKDIERIRFQILKSFQVGKWYSSAEIKGKISTIISENKGNVSVNRAGEIFQFLFETTENIKKIDSKNVRGYTIKSVK
jgi:hypothetical protein